MCALRAAPKHWISVTAPVRAVALVKPALRVRCVANGSVDDSQYFAHDGRLAGKQKAQRERYSEHPLTHGLMRKDLITPAGRRCPTIRRAPQLQQKPRFLQLNASNFSSWQVSHLSLKKAMFQNATF